MIAKPPLPPRQASASAKERRVVFMVQSRGQAKGHDPVSDGFAEGYGLESVHRSQYHRKIYPSPPMEASSLKPRMAGTLIARLERQWLCLRHRFQGRIKGCCDRMKVIRGLLLLQIAGAATVMKTNEVAVVAVKLL